MRKFAVWAVGVLVLPLLYGAGYGSTTTVALVDPNTQVASGWQVTYDSADTGLVVDSVTAGVVAIAEIDKNFTGGPNPVTNLLENIDLTFTEVAPVASTVPRIVIAEESITNQTTKNWTNFEWELQDHTYATFNVGLSGVFGIQPTPQFQTQIWTDLSGAPTTAGGNPAYGLTAEAPGSVAIGTGYTPGADNTGQLVIDTNLVPDGGDMAFTLKETPTFNVVPEPATMSLLGLGLGGLLLRRRRRA